MAFKFRKKKDDSVAIDNMAKDGYGQVTLPNPGELPDDWKERNTPLQSLGSGIPATGNRAGGGSFLDNGAKVGYLRNLEFSAGGRSALIRTGTTSSSVPSINEQTGQVRISSTLDDSASAGNVHNNQPAQPGLAKTEGDQFDSNVGTGPDRNRDRKLD